VSAHPPEGAVPAGYAELLEALKVRVRGAQVRAARAANTEVLGLYWSIGRDILDRQNTAGWGARVVDRLATDLRLEFPDQRGWSRSNLLYMRAFAAAWPDLQEVVPQAVGQLPWGHVRALLDRLQATLLEFGRGMAFVGRQVRLDLGDGFEVVVDLLLFNVEQLRYVVVELKVGRLAPGDVGQLGVYVAVVDDQLRRPEAHHAPTVGLLLVAGRSDPLAQYALAASSAPVAVADWASLPADTRAVLPPADRIAAALDTSTLPGSISVATPE
jgi:predicted nuclease of restriction endonuclease-like (RecB) superfamily